MKYPFILDAALVAAASFAQGKPKWDVAEPEGNDTCGLANLRGYSDLILSLW